MNLVEMNNLAPMCIVPALVGALWTIIVILYKGEICPGQRGRLHKSLIVIAIITLISALAQPWLLVPAAAIALFLSQVQFKKTRIEGPRPILIAAAMVMSIISLGAFVGTVASHVESVAVYFASGALWLATVVLLGAALTHGLLLKARSRLQAFHRLLPFAAITATFVYLLVWTVLMWLGGDEHLASGMSTLLVGLIGALVMMVCALVIWCWHIFMHRDIQPAMVWISGGMLLASHWILIQLLP